MQTLLFHCYLVNSSKQFIFSIAELDAEAGHSDARNVRKNPVPSRLQAVPVSRYQPGRSDEGWQTPCSRDWTVLFRVSINSSQCQSSMKLNPCQFRDKGVERKVRHRGQ